MLFIRICFLVTVVVSTLITNAQITPPYITDFENDEDNWSHSVNFYDNGADDWQRGGGPSNYSTPYSGNSAWCTNINGFYTNGNYALYTPVFDISDTAKIYELSFYHKYNFNQNNENAHGVVQYTVDGGSSWSNYNNSNEFYKNNWYGMSEVGFKNTQSEYVKSSIVLNNLADDSLVQFRFLCRAKGGEYHGWIIDDFELKVFVQEDFDIKATLGSYITEIPSNRSSVRLFLKHKSLNRYDNYYGETRIYHSIDSILDPSDSLLGKRSTSYHGDFLLYTLNNEDLLVGGDNFIIYEHDALNEIEEGNETNNVSYAKIVTIPTIDLPYIIDFEDEVDRVCLNEINESTGSCKIEMLSLHDSSFNITGSHHGEYALYNNPEALNDGCTYNYYTFPFLEYKGNNVLQIFSKNKLSGSGFQIYFSYFNGLNISWNSKSGSTFTDHDTQGWGYYTLKLDSTLQPEFRFRINAQDGDKNEVILDDIYLGPSKPDIFIQENEFFRFTTNNETNDSLYYYILNSGEITAPSSKTKFYYSTDSILSLDDMFLGSNIESSLPPHSREKRSFQYTKSTLLVDEYFIIAVLDADSVIDEMREYNNIKYFKYHQKQIKTTPSFEDFNSDTEGWYHTSDIKEDLFTWGIGDSTYKGINGNCFKSNEILEEVNGKSSKLYSSIYDLTTCSDPVMSFDMEIFGKAEVYKRHSLVNMSYSVDGGATWITLNAENDSYKKWYYEYRFRKLSGVDEKKQQFYPHELLYEHNSPYFIDQHSYQSRDDDGSENYIVDISHLKSNSKIQFRFNYATGMDVELVRLFIDNFKIEDRTVDLTLDYSKNLYLSKYSDEIELEYHIRNKGNYISFPTTINFYLSQDSLLDGGDLLISQKDSILEVKPDQRRWGFNHLKFLNSDLLNKEYLIFEIDVDNINTETDKTNNIGFYRLNKEGIVNYPFTETFDNYELHGWRSYNKNNNSTEYFSDYGHRYKNKLYHSENVLWERDGQMELDHFYEYSSTNMPTVYVESPSFDLSSLDSVFLIFDLSVITNWSNFDSQQSANLQYSVDGGENWSVLGQVNDPKGENWYDKSNTLLNNEDGWVKCDRENLRVRVFNATDALKGESSVTFRFQSKLNARCISLGNESLQFDNFTISSERPVFDLARVRVPDTIEVDRGEFLLMDSITIPFYNNSDFLLSSTIDFKWSLDSNYSNSFGSPLSVSFYSSKPNDTSYITKLFSSPYRFDCDSVFYLCYQINPALDNLNNYRINEKDRSNNEGFVVVKIKNYLPLDDSIQLNHQNDTIICIGESVELSPVDVKGNVSTYLWSNGNTTEDLLVEQTGDYFLHLVYKGNCVLKSDTIRVSVKENNTTILSDSVINEFCVGDSLKVFVDNPGTPNWSYTSSNDSVLYIKTGHQLELMHVDYYGCIAYDTMAIHMKYPIKPALSETGVTDFCDGFGILELKTKLNNFVWNTGDTTESILVNDNGDYFLMYQNVCGINYSDTVVVAIHKLIDSVTPNNYFELYGCYGMSIPLKAWGEDTLNYVWNTVSTINYEDIYRLEFSPEYYNTNTGFEKWELVEVGMNSNVTTYGYLKVEPNSDTVVFETYYIDISDYHEVSIEVDVWNELTDSVRVFYDLDGNGKAPFDIGGAVGYLGISSSLVSKQKIKRGNWVKIIVEFTGPTNGSRKQQIDNIIVRGVKLNFTGFKEYGSEKNAFFNRGYDYLLEVDNGKCIESRVVDFIDSEHLIDIQSTHTICKNSPYEICITEEFPVGFEFDWIFSSEIINSNDSCITVISDDDFVLNGKVTNDLGCEYNNEVGVYVVSVDTSVITNIDELEASNNVDFYQWLDCSNSYSVINGQTDKTFSPLLDGTYSVEVTYNGCVDTSSCIGLTCVESINKSLTFYNDTLSTNESGLYQWISCDDGYSIITGENNSFYKVDSSGAYAVIIDDASCIDTTDCFNVILLSIENDKNKEKGITLYPNPVDKHLNIKFLKMYEGVDIIIQDVSGKLLRSLNFNFVEGLVDIDLSFLSKGVYFVAINSKNIDQPFYQKILKN